jgi:beta-lactamase superfamily II metal-dependent hydrolase
MEKEGRFFNTFVLAILVIILFGLIYILLSPKPKTDSVRFFDVGQGDAALVETPSNQRILIDGGPNDSVVAKLDKVIPFYQRRLDAVILSHPHADHLDGLLKVLKTYEVKAVYMTGVVQTTPEYLEFLDDIKAKNIQAKNVSLNNEIDLGNDIRIKILYPTKNFQGQKMDNLNNSSIVAKLIWGNVSFLFTGDLEAEGQEELLKTGADVEAEVLKVPHHGSKDSADFNFDQKVAPKYAIISVGKDNQFGHPSAKALDFLKSVQVFRTDLDGDVKCDFGPSSLSCSSF